jgi:hypothetical protein
VLNVVAKGRGRKPVSKQATATKKTQPSKSPTLGPPTKDPDVRLDRLGGRADRDGQEGDNQGVHNCQKDGVDEVPRPGLASHRSRQKGAVIAALIGMGINAGSIPGRRYQRAQPSRRRSRIPSTVATPTSTTSTVTKMELGTQHSGDSALSAPKPSPNASLGRFSYSLGQGSGLVPVSLAQRRHNTSARLMQIEHTDWRAPGHGRRRMNTPVPAIRNTP